MMTFMEKEFTFSNVGIDMKVNSSMVRNTVSEDTIT
jgi:hypothetical protein